MLTALVVAVFCALGGIALAWKLGWSGSEVPIPPDVAPAIVELRDHFAANGIRTEVHRVTNMSAHAQTRALFRIKVSGEPTFIVYACRNAAGAAKQMADLMKVSAQTRPESNGSLVMNFAENPDAPVYDKVRESFRSFREGMAPRR